MAPEGFTHPPAAQLFEDAVMRDGLPDEGVRVRHLPFILGCSLGQVERTLAKARNATLRASPRLERASLSPLKSRPDFAETQQYRTFAA